MAGIDMSSRAAGERALVVAAAFLFSLPLTAYANRIAGALSARYCHSAEMIANAAVPSFLLIATLYACVGDWKLLHPPSLGRIRRSRAVGLSATWLALWLAGSVVLAVAHQQWPTYVHDWPTRFAFLFFGPIGEELLFRGLVQGLARGVWRGSATPAVLASAAAFSLHHLFIRTAPDGLLVAQIFFTVPMGLVFGILRERTANL